MLGCSRRAAQSPTRHPHRRIHRLLGIDRKRIKELKAEGEDGIVSEMMLHQSKIVDELGWVDADVVGET